MFWTGHSAGVGWRIEQWRKRATTITTLLLVDVTITEIRLRL